MPVLKTGDHCSRQLPTHLFAVVLHNVGAHGPLQNLPLASVSHIFRHLLGGSNVGGAVHHGGPSAHVGVDCTFGATFLQVRNWFGSFRNLASKYCPSRVFSPLFFNILVDGLAWAVHDACPGVSLMSRFSTRTILLSWLTQLRTFRPVLGSSRPRGGPRQPTICTMRVLVLVSVLPTIALGLDFLAAHPLPSKAWIMRCAGVVGSCWVGSPNVGLVKLGWPNAEWISSGRLLSLLPVHPF